MLLNLTIAPQVSENKPNGIKKTAKEFQKLFEENRLFELREAFEADRSKLSKWDELYFEAVIDNAFGKLDESSRAIDLIFEKYRSNFSRKKLVDLMMCRADNYSKLFNYAYAADALKAMRKDYGKIGKDAGGDVDNVLSLWDSLREIPPQMIVQERVNEVPILKNRVNHWEIPVKALENEQNTIQFVFDTGANLTTIRSGIAEVLGVIRTGNSINISNSVGSNIKAEIGYLLRMMIGDLVIENVVVVIFPDELLSFSHLDYQINGIIGFPVISALGEFSISKDQKLRISTDNTPNIEQNIFLSGMKPFIRANVNVFEECPPVTLLLDTGASMSHMSKRFFTNNKAGVISDSQRGKLMIGGVGKIKTFNHRYIKGFNICVAKRDFTLPKIPIMTTYSHRKLKGYDGFLGQDILLEPNEVVMNFRDMYLFFRD